MATLRIGIFGKRGGAHVAGFREVDTLGIEGRFLRHDEISNPFDVVRAVERTAVGLLSAVSIQHGGVSVPVPYFLP